MKRRIISAFAVLCISSLMISTVVKNNNSNSESSFNATAGIVSMSASNLNNADALVSDSGAVQTAVADASKYGYTNLGMSIAEGNLNIREAADSEASMVGKLPENGAVEILGTEGSWYHIKSGEVEGYVSAEFIITGEEALKKANEVATNKAKVTADAVHVRLEANTDSAILSNVFSGDELEVIAELGDWVQVNVDGETGYISAEFVECGIALPDAMTMSEARYGEGVSDVRVDLVNYALQFVGNPYVWGGTSLTRGADCSGFVLSIYSKYGISLPHSSRAQSNYGTRVSTLELQPGDLLFYGSGGISHVAIYIGGGQIVHASTETTGIIVSNAFYRNPICCTSLLN
ncbi:MAG: C40 family peptidase [Lachnospiraceae bacterium]|nr:C40 family peptidase [Lachnospiraceae bacterium]